MKVTLTWHGDNRFVGLGAAGAPVLINFPSGQAAPGAPSPSSPGPAPHGAGAAVGATDKPAYGPSAMELVLIAAGGCTGLDIVSLLQKQRVPFTGLEIDVSGERTPDYPKYFTDVEIVYRLKAAPEAKPALERAAQLSMDKYCSVGHSLRAVKTWRCEIVPEESPRG